MSEYQAYYFGRAEGPLSGADLDAVEQLSSHIRVGAHSAFVDYHYGDFKHDPVQVLERWFDVLIYHANWGSQTLAFRFDADRVNVKRLAAYAVGDLLTIRETGDVIVLAQFDENYGDFGYYDISEDSDRFYAPFIELYHALLGGDERALCLLALQARYLSSSDGPLPLPCGLGDLGREHEALIEFIDLRKDLVEAAAQLNPTPATPLSTPPTSDPYAKYLPKLGTGPARCYLERLLVEDPHTVRSDLIRELKGFSPKRTGPGMTEPTIEATFSSIDRSAEKLSATRRQKEADEQAARRCAYFERLEYESQAMWDKVPELIERKQAKAYDQAAEILYALKCLAIEKGELSAFHPRAAALINNYPTLRGMRSRMETAGVLPDDDRPKPIKKATEQKCWQESHPPESFFDFGLLQA
ncbi:hypothetical protein [Puniceicoccus vermicola]|uniref:Uncharacterized protein n=1 Tax=Puniceicoccus vermicola TaxID=388746 RepID=A0A7X1B4I1_9BACT|nr:hypothetical protein [Puniceicoccus vermicola]MBC2604245.1 hypothetical protein [Puniceicoccus vermicola]